MGRGTPAAGTATAAAGSKLNMDTVGTVNGVTIYEFDLDSVDDKPWRKPGRSTKIATARLVTRICS